MPPKRKPTRNNGRRYSETEKAVARQIVLAAGGIVTDELLGQVQSVIKAPGLSWSTLALWVKAPVEPVQTVTATDVSREQGQSQVARVEQKSPDFFKSATREIVEHTFRQYAVRANDEFQVETTRGTDAAKIMVDMAKLMQLLDGLPTEIIGAADELKELAAFFREEGIEMSAAIRQWRERLQARKAATKIEQSEVSNG